MFNRNRTLWRPLCPYGNMVIISPKINERRTTNLTNYTTPVKQFHTRESTDVRHVSLKTLASKGERFLLLETLTYAVQERRNGG